MPVNFRKSVPVKSYENVVEQIQTAICNGELKTGDRLPSELKLKDIFDTSRGTIREALRVLEQKGLVNIKTGVKGGAIVKESNTDAMSDSIGLLIQHRNISLTHLTQFRVLLESHSAYQAAILSSRDDLQRLKTIICKIEDHVAASPDNWEEFHRWDALFHQEIARIAGNPLVLVNLETIHKNIHVYFQKFLPFSKTVLRDDFQDLKRILSAIENGDSDSAADLAKQHVLKFSGLMKQHGEIIQ